MTRLLRLTWYSFDFQYLHPHKQSGPMWISCHVFYIRLYNWYCRRGGDLEDEVVRLLSYRKSEH
jgi:hypothetical protein